MQKALRLQQKPELDAVGRQAVEVLRVIEGGVCVQTGAPVFLDNARVLVRFHVRLRHINRLFELHAEVTDLALVGFGPFVAFGFHPVVNVFHILQGFFFGRPVLGADAFRALERHVLEHVGEAGFAPGIFRGARVHKGVERNDRGLVAHHHGEV